MLLEILRRLGARFSPEAISAYLIEVLPGLISGVLVFLIFWLGWGLVSRVIQRVFARLDTDRTLEEFIQTMLRYAILLVGLISALAEFGIDTKAMLASLGVVGLTLGFAARDTLSNLISGLFIFWDRPFVLGDLVEFGGFYGRVDQITMRSTRLVTVDGKMVAIPNANIINAPVISYTNFPHIRLDIEITVAVDQDLGAVRAHFLELVETEAQFLAEPPPRMVVTAINDYNVAVQFRVWLADEKEHISQRFRLREHLYEHLSEAGVDMPLETLSVELARPAEALDLQALSRGHPERQ